MANISHLRKNSFTIILIFFLVLSNICYAKADVVWVEIFDDESYLDNWWISHGNFTVEDGTLKGSDDCYSILGYCWDILWKNHTAITGTWSLDINFDAGNRILYFCFMGLSMSLSGRYPIYGYTLIIDEVSYGKTVNLANRVVEPKDIVQSHDLTKYIVQSHDLTIEEQSGWLHFDITRSETGRMKVFLNGSTILNYKADNFKSSETLNIQVVPGVRLDNIKFSNSIDVTSNEYVTYILVIGPILGLIAAVSIYIIRKKKN